ncbi:hypothetical protein [Actinophytocola algeriensis]|uniref:Tetratricopeptide repeat protein n=1 Tax=Actinophytocola algeriensis TaxID=1768010 RepID=A0A7W7Q162_9PSEU|nr:hypothetical protein [Actinophytocola algeriensis]MBB4905065.1 hypothetical protein [Actinophytocola algeriensis]MBE1473250.1 hypothetical protein [Actinophytocola algeriensis]
MKERLLAELDARVSRHLNGDSSGVLDEHALALVTELVGAGEPDAGSLSRVAALHLCRYEALPREHADTDLRMATVLYTKLHEVDPRLVPPEVRELFGLPGPHDRGLALLREYEQSGRLDHLERAISLFRQEKLEQRADSADSAHDLGTALLRRFQHTGQPADLDEAIALGRAALAVTPIDHPLRVDRAAWVRSALGLRSARSGHR